VHDIWKEGELGEKKKKKERKKKGLIEHTLVKTTTFNMYGVDYTSTCHPSRPSLLILT
jgi:hypothetical protein